jgi:hypothetical protein
MPMRMRLPLLLEAAMALLIVIATTLPSKARVAASPDVRGGHSMTFDERHRVTLMFGGGNRQREFNDLWAWDGQDWRLLSSSGPSTRDSAVFAYDASRRVAVLVGGRSQGRVIDDTWEWDGSTWRERRVDGRVTGPGERLHHYGAYDKRRKRLVVYGGMKPTDNRTVERLTDTWEWDGAAWTKRDAEGIPAFPSGIAYDERRGQVVLVAVDATTPPDGERPSAVWSWDGRHWGRVSDFADPTLSPSQPLVATAEGLLLLDGAMHKGNAAITWLWPRDRWIRSETAPPTPQRVSHAMAYDSRRRRVVMFGGHAGFMPGRNGEMYGDTWEWTGSAWTRVNP